MLKRFQVLIERLRRGLPRSGVWTPGPGKPKPTSRQPSTRPSELTEYIVLAGYCKHLKRGGSILDLGCGEGLLRDALDPSAYSCYVGVDSSEAAIRRASLREDEKWAFVIEDLHYYIPRDRFDIIVFGKALARASSPVAVVQRYSRYLKQHGIFLVSLPGHDNALWPLLDSVYHETDSVRIVASGDELMCKAYSTRPASARTPRQQSSETPRSAR